MKQMTFTEVVDRLTKADPSWRIKLVEFAKERNCHDTST